MAGRYGRKYAKNEDFEEGEIWGVMEGTKEIINPRKPIKNSSFFTTSSSSPRNFTTFTAPRMIPKSSSSEIVNKQSSAPVDIPDWSKIYSNKYTNDCNDNNYDDGEDDDDIDGVVPPHEYLARKFARNQISSFSVHEGIGRTLKGRDLSKVRNAILSKTGFLE